MQELLHYNFCPLCSSNAFKPMITCADHTVSGRSFEVCKCENCSGGFTQHVPNAQSIGAYYNAEAYVSHTNSNKGFINRLYQVARRYTLPQKRKIVEGEAKSGKTLLEVGAGTGHFAHEMQSGGWSVTGLEPDEGSRRLARDLHGMQLQPIEALEKLQPESFDAITLWHVLEHVHALHDTVQNLKRVLKSSGRLFIAVPNFTSADAGIYKEFWAAYDVPRHLYHFSPASMEMLIKKHGLQLVKTKPQLLDAWYVSLLSARYSKKGTLHALLSAAWCTVISLCNKKKASSLIYVVRK